VHFSVRREKVKISGRYISILLFCFVINCTKLPSQKIEPENIPSDVLEAVNSGRFAETYVLDGRMNPFYLRGDFDGDGMPDYALWINAKAGSDTGIAIWLSSQKKFIILGAGVPFNFAGFKESTFENLNVWEVYGKHPVERGVEAGVPPKLIGEAILVGKSESGSGLIYWTGKSFKWYQQGD
jgi:hypothetical protein